MFISDKRSDFENNFTMKMDSDILVEMIDWIHLSSQVSKTTFFTSIL